MPDNPMLIVWCF